MNCPVCREAMIVVEYRQIELDVCALCSGIWFDADELALLLSSLSLGAEPLFRAAGVERAEAARRCPRCRRKMGKVLTGPQEGVLIDRCARGHGLWFDGGELDTVIRGLQATHPGAGARAEAGGKVGSFLADVLLAGDKDQKKGGEPCGN